MDDVLAIGQKIRRKSSKGSAEPKEKQTDLEVEPPLPETEPESLVPNEVLCVSEATCDYKIGDRIEARFRGRGRRYYLGTIKQVLEGGGRYDIDYEDGDQDKALSAEFIRRPGEVSEDRQAQTVNVNTSSKVHEDVVGNSFEVGQKVEARYRGRGRR